MHRVESPADLVKVGLLTAAELKRFDRAERFFWSVRCHLHLLAGRAQERLNFDYQPRIAEIMHYADRPGKSAVERFMQFYFLNAKTVGDLTGVFLAQLDEQLGKKGFRFALPTLRRRPKRLGGFVLDRGRIALPSDDYLRGDPVRLLELFALAAREELEIHPSAMRAASRDAVLIDRSIREDPRANSLFLEVLTTVHRPEVVMRWMNEAGVFGRFVPDFGRVVAQMQFDMYHHYTVDEHSIRAIGLLAAIERGELKNDHPLSTSILQKQIASRRALYVAVLLHDIAKGRRGDHSILGAEVALKLCPRLGLDEAETETVAWLVRYHLLLSSTAFKRDLADPKTVEDFAHQVQSPERLRLLLILTVVDIRAVGPGIWNEWERSLLRRPLSRPPSAFVSATSSMAGPRSSSGGSKSWPRNSGWKSSAARAHARRLPDSYWLAEPPAWQLANARQVAAAEAHIGDATPNVVVEEDFSKAERPELVFHAGPGGPFLSDLRRSGGSRGKHIDARIYTTRDGMALDNLLVLDGRGKAYSDRKLRARFRNRSKPRLPARITAAPSDCRGAAQEFRLRGRRLGRHRRARVNANDCGGGECARPSCTAGRAGWRNSRAWPCDPFGPYRDLR